MASAPTHEQDIYLSTIVSFLNGIGITVVTGKVNNNAFLEGIEIKNGGLVYQPDKLNFPGDLLHEAGHIAVAPPDIRANLQDDVAQFGQGPAEEMAAIAWSWAAIKHLNIPPEVVFHKNGYKGASLNYIEAFANSSGFGHPMLAFWGMCNNFNDPRGGFPSMLHWLRC